MIGNIVSDFGGLNIVVNNAGLAIRKPFKETTPEEWRSQIDVNLLGAIHLCHAAAPHLEKGGHGRIIAIVGDSSRVGEAGLSIVGAARAGVIALMKSIAREMGRVGVTANTVSLGLIETAHDPKWLEANREKLVRFYPTRRLGQPDDIAPTVVLLASPRSGWITGQVISVSGGYCMI
jgi:3-oxoacyl-[acyl-carrier protein] reductase